MRFARYKQGEYLSKIPTEYLEEDVGKSFSGLCPPRVRTLWLRTYWARSMRIACIGARLEQMTGNGWQGAQVSMNILVMIPELHSIPFKFLDAFKFLFESVDEGTQREKVGERE